MLPPHGDVLDQWSGRQSETAAHEAREALAGFLTECVRREVRCVRVIHGKGLGSVNREPVLKGKVLRWLTQRDDVIAFCQAGPMDGGSGAVLVLLRPPPPPGRRA